MGKPKKGKQGGQDEEWEDDIAGELAALALEAGVTDEVNGDSADVVTAVKKKKKKTRKQQDKDEDNDDEAVVGSGEERNAKMAAAWSMLGDGDNDDADEEKSEKESEEEEEEVEAVKESAEEPTRKKKGKKGKAAKKAEKEEEEDIDAILAQIGSAPPMKKTPSPTDDADEDGATKAEDDDEEDDSHTVKTAAQKKKEKKERQKQQKIQAAKGKSGQQPKVEKVSADAVAADEPVATTAEPCEADTAEGADGANDELGDGEDDKKKKKDRKKKKKGEKEEEDKSSKKKPSKMVKAMQEQLRKLQEEEESHRIAEEEKIRLAEEAEQKKEETERVEKERKAREKQKKKERIDRLKAEGKFLTAKQKEAQRRAQQMLEAMREQGLEVPTVSEKTDGEKRKRVVYSKKKKPTQQQQQQQQQTVTTPPIITEGGEDEAKTTAAIITEERVEEAPPAEETAAKEASDEDTKDAWDDSEDEEEAKVAAKAAVERKPEDAVAMTTAATGEDAETTEDADAAAAASSEDDDSEDESSSDEEEESSSDEEEEEEEEGMTLKERVRERALARMAKFREEAEKRRTTDVLRAAVVCVLGHVDTGKTKILDKLRHTNVQDGEAGGITQQIGATNVPHDSIREQTKMCKEFSRLPLKVPGLLIIDTPGHESFSNLRNRGSSLCDIAILVVDIMHGLEPQTIESINLLKQRRTPFVVALNKVDRLFQWQANPHNDIQNTLKKQKANTKMEFDERVTQIIVQFAEQSLNAALFYENKNVREYVSLVPTSAHSGDGIGNLIALVCELSQTLLAKRIAYSDSLQATAMEVKALPGLGMTVDVILVNGALHEGETVVLAGTDGAIVTQIRGLLMPHPMREMRVKTNFEHHKSVQAAQGVKIIAKDLDKALAGLPIFVANHPDEVDILKEEIELVLADVLKSIKLEDRGVFVQSSTLGSLEALLEFLNTSSIPYAGINIGPVHKKDIMKASIMLEHDNQYAVILAFDVKVEREAQELADSVGVTIFAADIIYHLFDAFTAYRTRLRRARQDQYRHVAVFPCRLRVMPQYIFNSRDPIVVGVSIDAGFLAVGTPLCVPSKEFVEIGRVTSLELNHKSVERATRGQEVCVKIEPLSSEAPKMFGRHFDATDAIVSKISRQSIDAVKDYFRDDMTKTDWQLMVELKRLFEIL